MNDIKVILPRNEVILIDNEGNPLYVPPLEETEKLVDVGRFNDYVKPLYDEVLKDFVESANPKEIKASRPTPQPSEPSSEDYMIEFDYRLSLIEMGV